MNKRSRGAIQGIVQGVGFRPFVYRLAARHGLGGYVANSPVGVEIEVEGAEADIRMFARAVATEHPPLAYIADVRWEEIAPKNEVAFTIIQSREGPKRSALISPDVCICPDCLAELRDPLNRRFGYPFINCTNCGPRYTIIEDVPYDRPATTMRRFAMCRACQEEYDNPVDRRFHAQPNACWECGPKISLHDRNGNAISCEDPVAACISLLQEGAILAVKGLGGFHLVADASNHTAVAGLRKRKHREEKPLAVMVRDMNAAFEIAHVNDQEAGLLGSRQRPVVLLIKRRSHGLSSLVAPRNRYLGVMLPYTPLHYLLMDGPFRALVMTSGNMTEEPICIDNKTAVNRLKGVADYFLTHNRDIYLRSDDSVLKVVDGISRQIRRSRGYVPMPIFLPDELKMLPPVLAVGAELKNTICLTKKNRAFLSQHIGDMENLETFDFFSLTVSHLSRILEVEPEVVACDLHPDYLSTRFARGQKERPVVAVQHHHAHIVSCMAEHGLRGPVIGVAMDGTGLGLDGHIWGGEVIVSDLTSFNRKAQLEYVPLPGGDAAAKNPWRMALIYLYKSYGEDLFDLSIPFVRDLNPSEASIVLRMALKGINSPLTSSCGRLFDAVSALLGLRRTIAYEGQAAVELEMAQSGTDEGVYPWEVSPEGCGWIIKTAGIIHGMVQDMENGEGRGVMARRFHNTLIRMLRDVCLMMREETGIQQIAASGGVFQNATLLTGLTRVLEAEGFSIYTHARVPANDGGICLGQAVCAGLRHLGLKGAFEGSNEIYG
ncbi:MAG TPA: carbamoyltransferase HypF [Desulfobacteraceae bacterium]|nr:carbamoyltransferase HypF [Desulfobacteraceae bacterium]